MNKCAFTKLGPGASAAPAPPPRAPPGSPRAAPPAPRSPSTPPAAPPRNQPLQPRHVARLPALGLVLALCVVVEGPLCFCSVGAPQRSAHVRPLCAVHVLLMGAHRCSITTSISALQRARKTARAFVGCALVVAKRVEVARRTGKRAMQAHKWRWFDRWWLRSHFRVGCRLPAAQKNSTAAPPPRP